MSSLLASALVYDPRGRSEPFAPGLAWSTTGFAGADQTARIRGRFRKHSQPTSMLNPFAGSVYGTIHTRAESSVGLRFPQLAAVQQLEASCQAAYWSSGTRTPETASGRLAGFLHLSGNRSLHISRRSAAAQLRRPLTDGLYSRPCVAGSMA